MNQFAQCGIDRNELLLTVLSDVARPKHLAPYEDGGRPLCGVRDSVVPTHDAENTADRGLEHFIGGHERLGLGQLGQCCSLVHCVLKIGLLGEYLGFLYFIIKMNKIQQPNLTSLISKESK